MNAVRTPAGPRQSCWATPILVGAAALLCAPAPLVCQIVRGQVVDSVSGTPLGGGRIVLLGAAGDELRRTVADPEGLFQLRAAGAGRYRLRVEADGYRESEFPPFELAADEVRTYMLLVASLAAPALAADTASADIIARVCPDGAPAGHPVIVGLVSDATSTEPVAGAEVYLSWATVPDVVREHVTLENAEGAATTGASGFYGVCGAPVGTRIFMHAEHTDRVSEIVALTFEEGGVSRGRRFTAMPQRIWRQDLVLRPPEDRAAALLGIVTDTSGVPVEDAMVSVVGTTIRSRTGLLGVFRLEQLPAGDLQVRVEGVGYRALHRDLTLGAADTVVLPRGSLALQPTVPELPPVTVRGVAPTTRRDLTDFYKRRESTTGSFITRQEFEQMGKVQRTTDILRRMRGIYIRPGYGMLDWLITTRRGASRGSVGAECFPLVFMDGVYIGTTGTINLDQMLPAANLEAVEVHASAASLPAEFSRRGATCGVIVFWTR